MVKVSFSLACRTGFSTTPVGWVPSFSLYLSRSLAILARTKFLLTMFAFLFMDLVGNTKVLEYLIQEHKVDVNTRTNDGDGATALWWAQHVLEPDHPAIQVLRRHGAVAIGPFAERE
jgi:hypothetical protein